MNPPGYAPEGAKAPKSPGAGTQSERESMPKGEGTGLRALIAVAALVIGGVAQAAPGNGIRMGGSNARLHPFLELEGRYDSNVAFSDVGRKQSGYIFHVRPGLTLDSQSEPATLTFAANADWAQYTGANKDLSRLYGEASLGLGLNRKGELGLELTDAFRRSRRTQVFVLGGAVMSNVNELGVSLPWRPGGGAFVTTLSGGWILETFEPFVRGKLCADNTPQCDPSLVSRLDYSDVSGRLELRWRFLPRTSAVAQGEYWKRFPANTDLGAKASGWRAMGGLAGLFSAHLAGTVKGGWSSAAVTASSESTWYANVEGEWIPTETSSLKLGYLHDANADPGAGGGYASHRVYLDGRVLLAARYALLLDGQYEHRDYAHSSVLRSGDLLSASPTVEAEVARWFRLGAGAIYTKRTSQLASGATSLPGFAFDKTEVFLRARGTY